MPKMVDTVNGNPGLLLQPAWKTAEINNIQCDGQIVDVSTLKLDPDNARLHPERNMETIMESLATFGQRIPIVVRQQNMMVAVGNGRLAAVRKLGWTKIACSIRPMTDAEFHGFALVDNRSSDLAKWDYEVVARIDKLLQEQNSGVIGWSLEELSVLRSGDFTPLEEFGGFIEDDEVTEVPSGPPIAQFGDVWLLGPHRLMCGDSTNKEHVELLLNGTTPILMVTDPPYGVNYDPEWRNSAHRYSNSINLSGIGKRTIGAGAIGEVHNDSNPSWIDAYKLFLGQVVYIWHASLQANIVYKDIIECGLVPVSFIVWNKSNFAIGRGDYHWKHEMCVYAVRKGSNHNWQGSRKEHTVWEIAKNASSETGHSTQKPIECMGKPIQNNTAEGESVYDPFVGSGTTIIAAHQLKRIAFGMEISPEHCDTTLRRYLEFTGEEPIREYDGAAFSKRE